MHSIDKGGGKMTKGLFLSAVFVILYEADKACGERSAKRLMDQLGTDAVKRMLSMITRMKIKIWEA